MKKRILTKKEELKGKVVNLNLTILTISLNVKEPNISTKIHEAKLIQLTK